MFALRRFIPRTSIFLLRNYAADAKLVEVTENKETDIAVLSMARPPVNGLNLELLEALKLSLNNVQKSDAKGVILTSSNPKIFSAGLDIMEMYKPDLKRAEQFWNTLQETWLTLWELNLPVAAAINGASPAGGCLLAISCEYRVFVEGKHTIGLNETQLGIVAPQWFQDIYIATIGHRTAELALLKGSLFTPQEAIKINLVDELATDKNDAITKCKKYIESFDNIPVKARAITKDNLRKPLTAWLRKNRELDTKIFLSFIQMPKVQAGLELYMQYLKKK
ncbi:enoyl-CoA delta isomerase 1, mitochondrial-like [Prorops nasuta]|uniref:enoyl-CoA delta isomerase 1, mitochondrial-like n=1 Tax=Prorops nasuta TaxID=863751 RepID=UPI0034CE2270